MAPALRHILIETAALVIREAYLTPREVLISEAEYLSCLKYYTPVGVFGFYWWFSKLIGLLIASAAAIKVMIGSEKRWGGAIQALAAFAIAIFDMVNGLRTADQCLLVITNNDPQPRLLQPTRIARFFFVRHVGNGLILAAGWAEALSVFTKYAKHSLAFVPLAFLFHLLGASAFYVGFANFVNIDRSMLRPIMAVSIPLLVFLLMTITIVCIVGIGNYCGFVSALLLVLVIFFHIWAVGMGHILLGEAAGDIWGSYIVARKIGYAYATLTGAFPVLTIIGIPGQL